MSDDLVLDHDHDQDRDLDLSPILAPDHGREPLSRGSGPLLPHHKLIAYGVARDLLLAVRAADVRDAKLRDEALRSAKSACLNCAEVAPGQAWEEEA